MVVVRNNPKPVVFALKYSANDKHNLGRLIFHSVYLLVVFTKSSCLLESQALPRLPSLSSNIAISRHAAASLTLPMCFPCIYEYVPPYNRCRTQQKIMLILHYTKSSLSRVSPTKLSPKPPYNILYDPIAEICLGELFFPFHGDHVLTLAFDESWQ